MDANQAQDVNQTRMPLRAEALFNLLVWLVGKKEFCWPSQKWLAEKLGISVRQVKTWLSFLVDGRRIRIERTGRVNRYYICAIGEENFPSDGRKTSPLMGGKLPIRGAENFPSDERFSSPIEAGPLDGIDFKRGEQLGNANAPSPSGVENSKCKMPDAPEHPKVEELLKKLQILDAMPDEWKRRIEFEVTQESPLSSSTEQEFRMACAEMAYAPPFWLRFLQFKVTFIADAPGMPRDRAKWDFFDKLERKLERLDPTLEEMLLALEKLDEAPARLKDNQDPHNFAREAHRFLPGYILAERQFAQQRRKEAEHNAQREHAPDTPKNEAVPSPPASEAAKPISFEERFGDCAGIASDLKANLGVRFDDYFARTRFVRVEGRLHIAVPSNAVRDWIKQKFLSEVRQAATDAGLNGVDFVVEERS